MELMVVLVYVVHRDAEVPRDLLDFLDQLDLL